MKPVEFEQQNCIYAKDQPEYLPLPAHKTESGEVITCWKLTWRDYMLFLWERRIWLRQLTFNQPLQPQAPTIESPWNG